MDDCELITLVTAIACTISKCYSEDEISLMAVIFTQLGDTLSTVLLQKELKEKKTNNIKAINENANKENCKNKDAVF